jgi:hypothetical protein
MLDMSMFIPEKDETRVKRMLRLKILVLVRLHLLASCRGYVEFLLVVRGRKSMWMFGLCVGRLVLFLQHCYMVYIAYHVEKLTLDQKSNIGLRTYVSLPWFHFLCFNTYIYINIIVFIYIHTYTYRVCLLLNLQLIHLLQATWRRAPSPRLSPHSAMSPSYVMMLPWLIA